MDTRRPITRKVQAEGTYTLTAHDVAAYLYEFYGGRCGCGGRHLGGKRPPTVHPRTDQCVWCSASQVGAYLRRMGVD